MNQNEIILLMLKGAIAEATPEERSAYEAARADVEALRQKHGASGLLALVIAGIEASIEMEKA